MKALCILLIVPIYKFHKQQQAYFEKNNKGQQIKIQQNCSIH